MSEVAPIIVGFVVFAFMMIALSDEPFLPAPPGDHCGWFTCDDLLRQDEGGE